MSHSSNKIRRWPLIFIISLLFTVETTIAKQHQLLLLQQSDKSRRYYCRQESIIRHRHGSSEHLKRRTLLYSRGGVNLPSLSNGSAAAAANCCSCYQVRQQQDAIYNHGKRPSAAFVSNSSKNHHHYSKQLLSFKKPSVRTPFYTSSTTTTTTTLQLKFKTFEEMISHHHSTPLLIDFYAPWCGPCKLMKGEIRSIRDQLELLGPHVCQEVRNDNDDMEEEDCTVEDVIALSSVCLEDGYIEEQQVGSGEGDGSLSVVVKEDTQKILNDLLPPPSSSTEGTQSTKQQSTTTTTSTNHNPSGIPVYHVNTNKFPQVGAKNHIAGLPTLVLFYEGQELWRNEGLMKGEEIVKVLSTFQEGGWKRLKGDGEDDERKDDKVGVIAGEEGVEKKIKKRKGRRLGG